MHSTYVRAQNVFGYFTTIAFTLAATIALTSLFTPQQPSGSVQLRNVQVVKGRPHYYSERKEEYAHVRFDLDIDLSSLFTWNTKQVFVYVTAIYPPSPSGSSTSSKGDSNFEPASQAIIWDAILAAPSEPWHENQYVYPRVKDSDQKEDNDEDKYANYITGTGSDANDRKVKDRKVPSSSKRLGILRLRNQRPKYQITDMTGKIAGRTNATLQLGWNVQPWVGALRWRKGLTLMNGRMIDDDDDANSNGIGGVYSSESFDFPLLREKAGAADMGTAKGGEKNRGMPA